MIIKEVAFGDFTEAFIESRFNDRTNIVFSNENNRGKTLLMQSLMYSIGYDSIFPSGFDYKNYYYYSKLFFGESQWEFLRKKNSIVVLNHNHLTLFNSISEFKYFFDKEVFSLPRIHRDGELRIADLSLLYELFFLGQDRRNTSNLIVKGQNNKVDFIKMILAMSGVQYYQSDKYTLENLLQEKDRLTTKIKAEKKKITIIKKQPDISRYVSSVSDQSAFEDLSLRINEIHKNISELNKKRNREENRRLKLEYLILELNSINRNISSGKVACSDCGSTRIIFTNDDFEFEVSNDFVRNKILLSIKDSMLMKQEMIDEYKREIDAEQLQLSRLLETTPPDAKSFILFQDEILESTIADRETLKMQNQLSDIELQIEDLKTDAKESSEVQNTIINKVIQAMQKYYSLIDPSGTLEFQDIFTKNDQTYSGSEGQEYYFSKLMALNEVLDHQFPILIDSFRDGEISTVKESLMLNAFTKLNKQVIITSTLKNEEYVKNKYDQVPGVNVLDYSSFSDSKILQPTFTTHFRSILEKFNIQNTSST